MNVDPSSPRKAAYEALIRWERTGCYLVEGLDSWHREASPSTQQRHQARQLAYGCCSRRLSLDQLAFQLSKGGKLPKKKREQWLLRLALYEACFLSGSPLYGLVHSWVELAHQCCHSSFASYLNALLRSVGQKGVPRLPSGEKPSDLAIYYSYPPWFVGELLQHHPLHRVRQLLAIGNEPAATVARLRPGFPDPFLLPVWECLSHLPCPAGRLLLPEKLPELVKQPGLVIQGPAHLSLIYQLASGLEAKPRRILDLCAAPGGKLLLLADLYPQALLYANDVAPERMERLRENVSRYGVDVQLSVGPGQLFTPPDGQLFDLILIDAPCSNAAVLAKRTEARWRLDGASQLRELLATQRLLLERSRQLLAPQGELWYMSCSLLSQENQEQAAFAEATLALKKRTEQLLLPSYSSYGDGGYAVALRP